MDIGKNLDKIKQQITQTEQEAHRAPGSVLLLAVSKQQSNEAITSAFEHGQSHFGENYYQEALNKITQLKHLPIIWHFIGPIQSNKTKGIAQHFDWVHSINRLKTAEMLDHYRSDCLKPLEVCIQVNLIEEPGKSGIATEEVYTLAQKISQLPKLKLRGLMTIPPPGNNQQDQYHLFMQLNQLMHALNKQLNLSMDTLSMGMSNDLVPAIKAGATIVRVGRALFGERQGKVR